MAIAKVDSAIANGQNGGTSSSIDSTGATLLVLALSGIGTITVSDSKSNTWTPLTNSPAGSGPNCRIYYAANPTVGTGHTFTLAGTNIFACGVFTAWSGAKTSSPFDDEDVSSITTLPGTVNPAEDGEVLVIAVAADQAGPAASSGFTFDKGQGVIGGVSYGGWSLFQIQTTATSRTPTITGVDTSSGASSIACFKADTGTNITPTAVAATFTIPTPTISAPVTVGATAVAASFTIPTPTVKTGIWKVSDRGVRNSTSTGDATITLTDPTEIAVGNYLVCRVAVDNSGTNGALPGLAVTDSRSHTWTTGAGANQDPGVASAGASAYLSHVKVVTPFQAADTVLFNFTTGSPRCAIVIEEWAGIHATTPIGVAQTTANNVSSTAQPSIARTPASAGQLMYVLCAAEQLGTEWGAQDTDTTNGAWSDVTKDSSNTGTHDTSMSVYGGYKVVTAAGAQTWNNTLSATGDWAAVAIVYDNNRLENEYPTAVPAVFVIPTPTIDIPTGTNISATAVAATFVVPTPSIANITNVTPTAVAATFVIPTPAITVTTRPTPTAVAATFVVPTPTFNRTTTPTPTAVAATFTIPTPVVSTSVSATLTAVAGTFVIPTPTVSTGVIVNATAAAATFVVPTPTRTATANVAVTAVAASFTIPTPSVTTGSNTFVSVTAVAATFVVPTPAIAGTQVTPTAVAATFTIPTPAIAGTQVAATAAAATFVIPTPSVTTGSNTFVNVTAVALVAVIPTPTFNRTTTPTPAAVAMLMAVPAPGRTASANILATVLQAVFAIGTHIPTGQVIGGNVTSTVVLVGDVEAAVVRYGTTAGVALANNVTVVIDQ